jgi:hypothetical protein
VPFEHPVSARRVLTFNKEGATDESLLEGRLPPPESLRSFLVSPKTDLDFLLIEDSFASIVILSQEVS